MSGYHHLGLARDPFAPSPDGAMFYRTLGHEDCLQRLQRAIRHEPGLALVLGDAGYGKSSVKHALLHGLRDDDGIAIGMIDDPRACRTDVQFLRAILDQFGLVANGRSGLTLVSAFQQFAAGHGREDRGILLVIDEGHHLTSAQLDIVRSLLSAEPAGDERQRVAVAIFARPELEEKIRRKRNLARRVTMVHTLNPFNRRDTGAVIAHRLTLAGRDVDVPALFSEEAIDALYARTHGVPRAIIAAADACIDQAIALGHNGVDTLIAARASAIAVAQTAAPDATPPPVDRQDDDRARGDGPVQTRIAFDVGHDDAAASALHGGEQ